MFNDSPDFDRIDFCQRPDLYRVGKGEPGVLVVEPDNGELLPNWRVPGSSVNARLVSTFARTVAHDEEIPNVHPARKPR